MQKKQVCEDHSARNNRILSPENAFRPGLQKIQYRGKLDCDHQRHVFQDFFDDFFEHFFGLTGKPGIYSATTLPRTVQGIHGINMDFFLFMRLSYIMDRKFSSSFDVLRRSHDKILPDMDMVII